MRIMAQVAMVMNLDKCIGCHTCSVTCKQVWTNRPGTEYVYFNNVETKPGVGYPRRYEDQERWHGGWTLDRKGRVSGCPYKKVYFNHRTGKAEKCTMCFPRIESGQPTICSETCVGRLRYLGLFLYDADKVLAAATTRDEQDLYEAQLAVFLDPHDRKVQADAGKAGIPDDWIAAAQRSPVYELAVRHRVALPLHPEYRTLPMVWYIPPLSPVADVVHAAGYDPGNPDQVFATIDALRIPIEYLASLFTAGKTETVRTTLRKLAAVRAIMRAGQLGLDLDENLPASVGASVEDLEDLYRLLAIAKYEDRYVIPPAHAEDAGALMGQHEQLFCSLDTEGGPGMGGAGPHGIQSYQPAPPARRGPPLPGRRRPDSFQPARLERRGQRPGALSRPGHFVSTSRDAVSPCKLASVLLQYPTMALFDGIGELDAAAAQISPKASREAFARFLRWLRATPPTEVGQHYVETFDLRRRCALYLTYYRYGDTRKRGMSMLAFKTAYRAAGWHPSDDELPDYLPMVLDFAALSPRGESFLRAHRADLELLRRALAQAGTPYADVVVAVCAQLPKLGRREAVLVKAAWDAGPPREEVGLEPFAPPEYLTGYGTRP